MSNGPFRGVSSLFAAAAAVNLPIQANTAVPTSARHTAIEMNSAEADQLGLSASYTAITTVEAASAAIAALHEQLDEIPISEKVAYMCAKQTKPELVDDEEMIKFLLAENFKAPVSGSCLIKSTKWFIFLPGIHVALCW
jgi:precorrin-2 methylase